MLQRQFLGLGLADQIGAVGGNGVVLDVGVKVHHCAGVGVDLIVVLPAAGIKLHLIDGAAVVPVQLQLEEGDLLAGESGVLQRQLLGLGLADVAGVVVMDDHGLAVVVPGDLRPQQLTQGGQGQVGGAVVDQGGDLHPGGVPDGVGGAVDLQRHVGAEGGGHAVALAGGGGPHRHAAGEGEGGDDVRLFHVCFLSFSAVQAALVCASDYEMHGDRVLLRGRKNFFLFSPARARGRCRQA